MSKTPTIELKPDEIASEKAVLALKEFEATADEMWSEYLRQDAACITVAREFNAEKEAESPRAASSAGELMTYRNQRDGLKFSWNRRRDWHQQQVEKFVMTLILENCEKTPVRGRQILAQRDFVFQRIVENEPRREIHRVLTNQAKIAAALQAVQRDADNIRKMNLCPLHLVRQAIRAADLKFEALLAKGFSCDEVLETGSAGLRDLRFSEPTDRNPERLATFSPFSNF